ncbi:glycosyltransferase family 4 protein [Mucilaginibacter sp.]|jgi:glycosyltransferase involved in cell wall biosynthesis|uniref:glycosyltransferase family 4 protein n=1 Tax=Mucilaginibacter sp. TaxID=1882438 RepID=UPI00356684BB
MPGDKNLLITGDLFFIKRYHLLIKALQKHFNHIETLSFPHLAPSKRRFITDIINGFPYINYFKQNFERSLTPWAFDYKSKILQKRVAQIKPDIVLQIFGQACSVKNNDLPFAMTLDFTVALAEKIDPIKRFSSQKNKEKWMEKEREAYEKATFLFPWSNMVAQSLQTDYGIDPKKMIVIGSSGNLQDIFPGEKKFGSKVILFNGSDFHRKGGDILIEAFTKAYSNDPTIKLYILGIDKGIDAKNVFYKGSVNQEELKELFAECDIVAAPARCDPYPGFIIEAMQFGIPSIVSDRGGMPEIVDHLQNGIVLPELSASQLSIAISDLLNDHTSLVKYSKAAQNKVRSTLNWDFVANNMASTFTSCF